MSIGSIQTALDEMTRDTDLDFDQFCGYLTEVSARFKNFYQGMMKDAPDEFKSAMTKAEWMEEFQAYIDTLDGEHPETEDGE